MIIHAKRSEWSLVVMVRCSISSYLLVWALLQIIDEIESSWMWGGGAGRGGSHLTPSMLSVPNRPLRKINYTTVKKKRLTFFFFRDKKKSSSTIWTGNERSFWSIYHFVLSDSFVCSYLLLCVVLYVYVCVYVCRFTCLHCMQWAYTL